MAVYDDQKQNKGSHDDLGVPDEHREAENEQLEKRYQEPSAAEELGHKEGLHGPISNENEDKKTGADGKPVGSDDLSAAEKAVGSAPGLFKPEGKSGYKGAAAAGVRIVGFFWGSRRRKQATIAGGSIAGLLIAGALGFSTVSGPLELVHLAEQLKHDFTKSQSDSEVRTTNLLRYAIGVKQKDLRYTRVSLIGAKVMQKVIGQFEDAGVSFTGKDSQGRPTGIQIDRSKVEKNFPETKGMSDEEFNNFLNEKFGIDTGTSFGTVESGKSYGLDIGGFKSTSIRSFINNTSTEILGDSKAISAIKTRPLKQFFGLDSLFHPFTKAINDKIAAKEAEIKKQNPKESDGDAQNQAETQVENDTYNSAVSSVEQPGIDGYNTAKGDGEGIKKIASKANQLVGYVWITGCVLRDSGTAITAINRNLTVLPAALEATQLVAYGSQIQNGQSDVSENQITGIVSGLSNSKGQTIWSGAALQAMGGSAAANSLPKDSNGNVAYDLPGDYQQAFSDQSIAGTLTSVGNGLLDMVPFSWASHIPGIHLDPCGLTVGVLVGLSGIVYTAVKAFTAPESGGLSFAITAGIEKAFETAAQAFIGSKLLGFVTNKIINTQTAPKLARDAFSGPVGGDLIAYGARAASNTSAILNGGIALANNTSTIVGYAGQQEQQQFRSESMFAKIFDVKDYRSLMGHLSMDISPVFSTDVSSGINSILNIGGTLGSIFGKLIPGVSAAGNTSSWTGSYDWGFPQYGIPDYMLHDPALADPYQNAESVGQYLSSVCKDGSTVGPQNGACGSGAYGGLTKRIMDCTGNNLTYSADSDVGGSVWDVQHTATATSNDVDPNSQTYQNANCGGICPGAIATCGNAEEINWERIIMFINDAHTIKALDCAAGYTDTSNQSCQDEGEGDNNSTAPNNTQNTGLPSGTAQQLAQQLLNNPKVKLTGPDVLQDVQDAANGQPSTAGHPLSQTLLSLLVFMGQSHSFTISALESGGSGHAATPKDPHYNGDAVDITALDGDPIANSGIGRTPNDQALISQIAPLMPKSTSSSQSGFGQSNCGPTPPLPAGIVTFSDTCSHLHIQIPLGSP